MTVRLGLDASLRIPSCAISIGNDVVLATNANSPIEGFTKVIREAIRKAQLSLKDIEEIVVCVGPGSHMGVRAAIATANALALALQLPVTGVLGVDALATTAPASMQFSVAIPAGRGRWYTADYHWIGDRLLRLGSLQMVGELPQAAWCVCESDAEGFEGARLNAGSILVIADCHRHLTTQALVREITLYELGGNCGF